MLRKLDLKGLKVKMPLKNIPRLITPQLLEVLATMGHGDDLLISDANFPSHGQNVSKIIHCEGTSSTEVLEAVLQLLPLDSFAFYQAAVMKQVDSDEDATIIADFQKILDKVYGSDGATTPVKIERVERFNFYDRAKKVFAICATGESRLYGNIIIKKGVIDDAGKTVIHKASPQPTTTTSKRMKIDEHFAGSTGIGELAHLTIPVMAAGRGDAFQLGDEADGVRRSARIRSSPPSTLSTDLLLRTVSQGSLSRSSSKASRTSSSSGSEHSSKPSGEAKEYVPSKSKTEKPSKETNQDVQSNVLPKSKAEKPSKPSGEANEVVPSKSKAEKPSKPSGEANEDVPSKSKADKQSKASGEANEDAQPSLPPKSKTDKKVLPAAPGVATSERVVRNRPSAPSAAKPVEPNTQSSASVPEKRPSSGRPNRRQTPSAPAPSGTPEVAPAMETVYSSGAQATIEIAEQKGEVLGAAHKDEQQADNPLSEVAVDPETLSMIPFASRSRRASAAKAIVEMQNVVLEGTKPKPDSNSENRTDSDKTLSQTLPSSKSAIATPVEPARPSKKTASSVKDSTQSTSAESAGLNPTSAPAAKKSVGSTEARPSTKVQSADVSTPSRPSRQASAANRMLKELSSGESDEEEGSNEGGEESGDHTITLFHVGAFQHFSQSRRREMQEEKHKRSRRSLNSLSAQQQFELAMKRSITETSMSPDSKSSKSSKS